MSTQTPDFSLEIACGAKLVAGVGSEYAASTAPASAPREEISVADIGDDIPF